MQVPGEHASQAKAVSEPGDSFRSQRRGRLSKRWSMCISPGPNKALTCRTPPRSCHTEKGSKRRGEEHFELGQDWTRTAGTPNAKRLQTVKGTKPPCAASKLLSLFSSILFAGGGCI